MSHDDRADDGTRSLARSALGAFACRGRGGRALRRSGRARGRIGPRHRRTPDSAFYGGHISHHTRHTPDACTAPLMQPCLARCPLCCEARSCRVCRPVLFELFPQKEESFTQLICRRAHTERESRRSATQNYQPAGASRATSDGCEARGQTGRRPSSPWAGLGSCQRKSRRRT